MPVHRIKPALLERTVRVVVVGCGGTGSAVAAGLPYLHQAMLAFGHPAGLDVTLVDDDRVSEVNCVRQPFTQSEVGLHKSVILATRLNLFWGLEWRAMTDRVNGRVWPHGPSDLVIGCVDTAAARAAIAKTWEASGAYWLDFGNEAEKGQFILGEFAPDQWTRENPIAGKHWSGRKPLPNATMYPELVDASLDADDGPSCSAAEALTRQAPFVNPVLAYHGLALLSRLFRYGQIDRHRGFVNLETGRMSSSAIPPECAHPEPKTHTKKRVSAGRRQPA